MSEATRERPGEEPSAKAFAYPARLAGERPTPEYLMDANYYRLAYQLIAQQANGAEVAGSDGDSTGPAEKLGRGPGMTAEGLLADVDRVLKWLETRQQHARYPWRSGLSVSDVRLQLFLAATVEPCTLLVIAARRENLATDPLEFVGWRRQEPRVKITFKGIARQSLKTEIPWSYRAYYSLACSYAAGVAAPPASAADTAPRGLGVEGRLAGAFAALDQAFRRVQGRARVELWHWASKDPSLARLKAHKADARTFEALLCDYAPPIARPATANVGGNADSSQAASP